MTTRRFCTAVVLLTAVFLLAACSEDDTPLTPPVETVPGYPSADHMAAAYVQAYENMDYNEFRNILHPDYQMNLQQRTIQEFPLVGDTFDRAEEWRIAERMFSGQPVTDPDGSLVPAIGTISFDIFQQQTAWAEVAAGQEFAGEHRALYDFVCLAYRPTFSTLRVAGQLVVYAAARDTVINGSEQTYWQMIGMTDLTGPVKQAGETETWGSVKALYWIEE